MTSTAVGWALIDRSSDAVAPGAVASRQPLAAGEFSVTPAAGVESAAFSIAAQLHPILHSGTHLVRGVAMTWSPAVVARAALVLEFLNAAGFEVVPVRLSRAARSLASGTGYDRKRAAVCIVEAGMCTVVRADGRVAVQDVAANVDDLTPFLTKLLGADGHRPEVVVIAEAGSRLDRAARRLEAKLSVPVFVHTGALPAMAGAMARRLVSSVEFAQPATALDLGSAGAGIAVRATSARPLAYTGARAALVAGVLTLVVSASAALSPHLGPGEDTAPAKRMKTTVAVAPSPAPVPIPAPLELPEAPVPLGALWESGPVDVGQTPMPPPMIAPPPSGPKSLLNRVRDHLPRLAGH